MNPTAITTESHLVRVRFFAAAKAEAGTAETQWTLPAGTTVHQALALAGLVGPVFIRSSFLINGVASRPGVVLLDGDELDVLPPYAGG